VIASRADSTILDDADQTISDATTYVLEDVSDGDVVVGGADPMPFLIADGKRRPFEGPESFFSAGFEPSQVKVVSDPKLALMPLGDLISAEAIGVKSFDSGAMFLGWGHYMRTWGALSLATGQIAAQTRIWTITWFGGYHGAVDVILGDANDAPVYQTRTYRYGVDGTWIGRSDLTTAWWESMSPADAGRVTKVNIFHTWAPDDFQTIVNKWKAAAESITQLWTAVAPVAKIFGVSV
jgi:hypothetical protein